MNMGKDLQRSFGGSLGFSFEESEDNFISDKDEYRLKTYEYEKDQSSDEMESSDFAFPQEANRIDELSKISDLMNSKEIIESRESIGKYLNLSHSREASA